MLKILTCLIQRQREGRVEVGQEQGTVDNHFSSLRAQNRVAGTKASNVYAIQQVSEIITMLVPQRYSGPLYTNPTTE